MMTKKDFELIASALHKPLTSERFETEWRPGIDFAVGRLATALETAYPRFDRMEFLGAYYKGRDL